MIVGVFGAFAAARQYPGWQVSPEDALAISKPLGEVLKKYPQVFEKALEAAAPLSLVAGAAWIIGPRIVADRAYHAALLAQQRQQRQQVSSGQGPPPVAPPGYTGPQAVPNPPQGTGGGQEGAPFPKFIDASVLENERGRAFDGLPTQ